MVYGGIEKMNRKLIVGGSVGAVALLVLMSFNSVVAFDVNRQIINKEKRDDQYVTNLNLLRNYLQNKTSSYPKFDIIGLLLLISYIFAFIFDIIISNIVWIYDIIFGW